MHACMRGTVMPHDRMDGIAMQSHQDVHPHSCRGLIIPCMQRASLPVKRASQESRMLEQVMPTHTYTHHWLGDSSTDRTALSVSPRRCSAASIFTFREHNLLSCWEHKHAGLLGVGLLSILHRLCLGLTSHGPPVAVSRFDQPPWRTLAVSRCD